MRKIVAAFFVSLDGVVEAPDTWHFPYMNDEMEGAIGQAMSEFDSFLMGRINYQEWAQYWPNQSSDIPFADYINSVPKYVVSTTLETAEWQNSTLINGDVAHEIAKLKQQPGKNITITGSATLVRSLLRTDLLDELRLMVHPIVVGNGGHLFEGWTEQKGLKLVDARTFRTGVQYVTYQPVDVSG